MAGRTGLPADHRALGWLKDLSLRVHCLGGVVSFPGELGELGIRHVSSWPTPPFGALVWAEEDGPPLEGSVLEQMLKTGAVMLGLQKGLAALSTILGGMSERRRLRPLFPGADLPLDLQGWLVLTLGGDPWIRCSKDHLLVPKDSISAILVEVNPGDLPDAPQDGGQCGTCGNLRCPYRSEGGSSGSRGRCASINMASAPSE